LAIVFFDLRGRVIPDSINLVGFVLALPFFKDNFPWFLAVGGLMLLMAFVSNNAIGGGDVKYAAVMALFIGMKTFSALAAAFLLCGVVTLFLLAVKKVKLKDSVPFGPYLFLGGLYVILGGEIFPWLT
jgi:leader peptidase (prepilin peptidase)/N-methyltransferase